VRTTQKLLEEVRAQGARLDRVLEEMRAERRESEARWERRDADLQQVVRFNTEAFRRSELVFADFHASFADFHAAFADFRTEQQEMREDIRAHRRALLALIDRLEGGGGAPAT